MSERSDPMLETTLWELIEAVQECGASDAEVVAVLNDLIARAEPACGHSEAA